MYILVCVAFIEIFNVLEIKDVCTEILGSRLVSVIILCSSALKYFFVERFLSYSYFYLQLDQLQVVQFKEVIVYMLQADVSSIALVLTWAFKKMTKVEHRIWHPELMMLFLSILCCWLKCTEYNQDQLKNLKSLTFFPFICTKIKCKFYKTVYFCLFFFN